MNAEILSPLSPRKNTLSGVWWTREGFCAKSVVARLPPRFSFLFFTLAPRANLRERGASHTSLSTKKHPLGCLVDARGFLYQKRRRSPTHSFFFSLLHSRSSREPPCTRSFSHLSLHKKTPSRVFGGRERARTSDLYHVKVAL